MKIIKSFISLILTVAIFTGCEMVDTSDDLIIGNYTTSSETTFQTEAPQTQEVIQTTENLSDDKLTGTCFIMGDFNSPSAIRGEGYDYVKQSGWYDTYILADNKDEGITVGHVIDGWRERMDTQDAGMRIDYIWCNHPLHILESEIILNGMNYPIVSDHYGVQIMINKI